MTQVWLAAKTLYYPQGGGHFWAYLNWALGLQALGCQVIWLEAASPADRADKIVYRAAELQYRLAQYGLENALALCSSTEELLPMGAMQGVRAWRRPQRPICCSMPYIVYLRR